MNRTILILAALVMPLSAAYGGGTFLGKDPQGDKDAAGAGAFGAYSDADQNGDATITKDEWLSYLANNRDAPAFDDMDKNKDGKITTDEHEFWAKQGQSDSSGAATGGGDGTAGQP